MNANTMLLHYLSDCCDVRHMDDTVLSALSYIEIL